MKKTSKSIAALFVALMVVMSFMVPAFAASTPTAGATSFKPTNTSTATVNVATGNANDTLYMYKVVDAQFNPTVESNNLVKTFTTLFQAFLTAKGNPLTVAGYAALENDSAALKLLLGDFTAYVKTNSSATPYSATTNAAGKAVFTNIPMGQYIVVGGGNTNGAFIYQTVTAEVLPHIEGLEYKLYPSYDVAMKTEETNVTKEITGGTTADGAYPTVSLGDVVSYKLKVAVPVYPAGATNKTFFVGDALAAGLKLNADSIVVKGYTSDEATPVTLAAGTAYTTDTTGAAGNGGTFYVDFAIDQIAAYADGFVTVEYTATITDQAVLGTAAGNKNEVTLVFSNDPFNGNTYNPNDPDRPTPGTPGYGSDEDEKIVYTYALIIDKFEEKHEGEKLIGATFDVYLADAAGVEIPKSGGAKGNLVNTITTDANGIATLERLEKGTYYLVETVAPTGYNLAAEAIVIEINSTNIPYTTETSSTVTHYTYTTNEAQATVPGQAVLNGELVWMNNAGDVKTAATQPEGFSAAYVLTSTDTAQTVTTVSKGEAGTGFYKVGVSNSNGLVIPGTGGMGTTIFYVIGGLVMVAAVVVLITRKRMCLQK